MGRKLTLIEYDSNIFAGDDMGPAIQFRDQIGAVRGQRQIADRELAEVDMAKIDQQIQDMFDYARPLTVALKDYFNTGDDGNPACTYTDWLGFTFVAGSTYTLTKIRLKLLRGPSDVGSPYVSIRNASGNFPVGSDLAYATRPYTDVSLSPGSWLDFELSTAVNIVEGNSYTIILRCAEDDPDGWDLLGWRADNDPGASYGVSIVSDDSGTSWVLGTEYGQGANLAYMYECWGY